MTSILTNIDRKITEFGILSDLAYTQVSYCYECKCSLNWNEEWVVKQLLHFVLTDVCGPVSRGCHINKLELFLLEVAMWIFWPNKDS